MATTDPISFPSKRPFNLALPQGKVLLFLVICVLPTILTAIYYGLLAKPEYVTTVTFGVRPGEPAQTRSEGAGITQAVPFSAEIGITSYGVVQYINSDAFVHDLSKRVDLDALFGPQRGDLLDHLQQDAGTDTRQRFLRSKIKPYFDITTGLVTVEMDAFSAQDSYDLSRHVLTISEGLINAISDRIRNDAVESSNRDLGRVLQQLNAKRLELASARKLYGLVDPSMLALNNLQLVNKLREDLITLQAQRNAIGGEVNADSPIMKNLDGKIGVVKAELHELNNTAGLGASAQSYAPQLEQLENLKSDISVLEKQYASASDAQQRQITNAERQSLYLVRFVDAVKPDGATKPYGWRSVCFAFIASFLAWAIVVFAVQATRDHLT
jgi:capsular polysaccharide transport system permease protein